MLLSQILYLDGSTGVVARDGPEAAVVRDATGSHALAFEAVSSGRTLAQVIAAHGLGAAVDLADLAVRGCLTRPITPLAPGRLRISGGVLPGGAGLAAVHVVGPEGEAVRIGWTLAAAVRPAVRSGCGGAPLGPPPCPETAFGPEILTGDLPADLHAILRFRRAGVAVFEARLRPETQDPDEAARPQSGRPGDVYLHLSPLAIPCPDAGFLPRGGDILEIEAEAFGLSLLTPINPPPAPARAGAAPQPVRTR